MYMFWDMGWGCGMQRLHCCRSPCPVFPSLYRCASLGAQVSHNSLFNIRQEYGKVLGTDAAAINAFRRQPQALEVRRTRFLEAVELLQSICGDELTRLLVSCCPAIFVSAPRRLADTANALRTALGETNFSRIMRQVSPFLLLLPLQILLQLTRSC